MEPLQRVPRSDARNYIKINGIKVVPKSIVAVYAVAIVACFALGFPTAGLSLLFVIILVSAFCFAVNARKHH